MWNYEYEVPAMKRVRYIMHTDAKNEADDQYTIAHGLMTDYLDVKGIIAGHFCLHPAYEKGMTTKASYDEIVKIVDLMHLTGKYPILMGATEGLVDEKTPIESDGAKFIVEEAMKNDTAPLFIGLQGAITDLASAILMEPRICDRMTAIWIGGDVYPQGGQEFNLMMDVNGANVVFSSQMPLWQVNKSVYKTFTVSLSELQLRVRPHGQIGKYLFDQLVDLNNKLQVVPHWPHGECWSLGDEGVIAALLEEREKTDIYEEIPAPRINPDGTYVACPENRKIRVYKSLNVRLDLEDLYAKLAINFPYQDS